MYYHASPFPGITILEPRISNHNIPLIYFSEKRENVLVYLSNAVEKFCRETGFAWPGPWQKWGPYGFTKDGRLEIQEYYPNALEETYAGVTGYIYSAERISPADFQLSIPHAVATSQPVTVAACEWVPDALEAILQAERQGEIAIARYEMLCQSEEFLSWNERTIRKEFCQAENHPEYRHFLKAKFSFLK